MLCFTVFEHVRAAPVLPFPHGCGKPGDHNAEEFDLGPFGNLHSNTKLIPRAFITITLHRK